jgi:hypothetical protein
MNAAEFGPDTATLSRKSGISGLLSNVDIALSPTYLSFGFASRVFPAIPCKSAGVWTLGE